MLTLEALCGRLSISPATGRNWLRLGKLVPASPDGPPLFDEVYAEALLRDLSAGESGLAYRRNKTALTGRAAYSPFREELASEAVSLLEELAGRKELSHAAAAMILAAYAVHMLLEKPLPTPGQSLRAFFADPAALGPYPSLIVDLLEDTAPEAPLPPVLEREAVPMEGDFLGALYLTLRERGGRQAAGAFYTPRRLVKQVVEALEREDTLAGKLILDPCCGSGGFLLAAAERTGDLSRLHGRDIDPVAVKLCRVNLAARLRPGTADILYRNIAIADVLREPVTAAYDMILGNPPWGYRYDREQRNALAGRYRVGDRAASCDYFVENGLNRLREGGMLCYLLPEAMLHVERHAPARSLLLERGALRSAAYLGEAFPGVQCPAILLCAEKGKGARRPVAVHMGKSAHRIGADRELSSDYPCLNATDAEYALLEQLRQLEGVRFLKGNADFALGIVTGNNRELLRDEPGPGLEPVIRGREVSSYGIAASARYLAFQPERFQQYAPEALYRAPEKLVYRFIGRRPVFALDAEQRLTLNSCNILIPRLEGLDTAYVLAVLNSRVAAFYCGKRFRSVKLLRSHIEAIPIPNPPAAGMMDIAARARQLCRVNGTLERLLLIEELDEEILALYKLSGDQRTLFRDCPELR